jgi:hypothetical protein
MLLMSDKNKESIIKEVYTKFLELGNKSEVARVLNLPRTTVRRYIDQFHGKQNVNENITGTGEDVISIDVPDGMTEEDIYKEHGLDPSQWQITNITKNEWTTPFKTEDGEVEYATNKQNKVTFKKIVKDLTLDVIKEQYKLMGEVNKHAPVVRNTDSKKKPVMYEIAIFDHHFSKLAWAAETGESYDLKIAEELFMNAVYDLLAKASHLNIEKILLPLGQDLFNSDGMVPETTAGTRQDNDSRYTKTYTVVSKILVNTINLLRKCADVDIVIVPSNHDYATMFYIGEYLDAWYRKDKHVNVNNAPISRKYYRYGKTLIGFTHGNEEKHDKLPLLMAREAQEEWAKVDFMQWHVGHLHKKRVTKYTDGDTFNGVEVKILPSLTSSDFWHHKKGYVKGNRMATGMVFDKEEGCIAEYWSKYIKGE